MQTIHVGTAGTGGPAVAVAGERIAGVGPAAALRARFPGARVREWPGVLGPGRVHDGPVPEAPSPRERVHALLRSGVTAVPAAALDDPALRAAAARAGLLAPARPAPPVLAEGARADLAVLDSSGACVATVLAGRVVYRRA